MLIPWLVTAAFAAPGARVEAGWTSSSGPDHYGSLRVEAVGGDVRSGAWLVGGTRSAALGTAGSRFTIGTTTLELGLALGAVRSSPADPAGATAGGELGLSTLAAPGLWVVGDLDGVAFLGWRAGVGVDRAIGRWVVAPRLRTETWAGDADLAVRAELGLRWVVDGGPDGWCLGVAASAGGRDVVHLGPGLVVTMGRE